LAERQEGSSVVRHVWDRSTSLPQILETRDGQDNLIRRYESDTFHVRQFRDAAGQAFVIAEDVLGTPRGGGVEEGAAEASYPNSPRIGSP
jgi:hypothetical protein